MVYTNTLHVWLRVGHAPKRKRRLWIILKKNMKNCWQIVSFCAFSLSSSQKRQKWSTCTHQRLKIFHSLFVWLAVFSVSDTSHLVCLSDRPTRWWSLFHSRLKSSCNSVVYYEMVGRQEAASFPPYSFTNHGSCFFVSFFPSSSLSSFPCFCLCCAGFSQLCSPRRAFSEQGPLRLIKSASFFSGWRLKLAMTDVCQLHACV